MTVSSLLEQQKLQEGEVTRLLDEISHLHEECYRI